MRSSKLALLGALALVFAVLAIPLEARAQSIAETLEAFHLFGTWSPDCNEPPTRLSGWIAYIAAADGTVTHQQIFDESGKGYNGRVLSARRMAADRLELTYEYGRKTVYLLLEFRDDRYRSLEARFDETVNVADGIMKATGKETVWLSRCRSHPTKHGVS